MQDQYESANNWNGEGYVVKEVSENGSGYILTIQTEQTIKGKKYDALIDIKIGPELLPIAKKARKGDWIKVEGPLSRSKAVIPIKFQNVTHKYKRKGAMAKSGNSSLICM